ncbi:MAG TPA: malonic semialdehyde reductase [Alphaproteobacteria bacterium]|nr:malonic semialdehyde reductase [Alphaproteobacteria bacterium]
MLHTPNLSRSLNDRALDQLFREARTHFDWTDEPVPDAAIRQLYDLVKMGPTSMNNSPARFAFIGSPEGKARLKPHLMAGNVDKTMSAPWTVIIATDTEFYEHMPVLFPHAESARDMMKAGAGDHGPRNATLQGAYLILAARALGLDTGPMSGFDQDGIDREFFESDPAHKSWKSNFLVNLGHGTGEKIFPRLPRLSFDEAALIV